MSKHTPGPWSAEEGRHNSGVEADNQWGSIVADNYCVAAIWADAPNYKEDARLIAAAPDLLETLRWIGRQNPEAYEDFIMECRKRARAAIAKAEEPTP